MKKPLALFLPFALALCACSPASSSSEVLGPEGSNFLRPIAPFSEALRRELSDSTSRIEDFSYTHNGISKKAKVYLPEGYDSASRNYDVVYFLHGANGSEETVFAPALGTKPVLDRLTRDGKIDPVIFVTPTYYQPGSTATDDVQIDQFLVEMKETLIPELETHYRTHLSEKSDAAIKATRDHRTFGGYSMGGITTWSVMWTSYDYFYNYIPMSGYCNRLTPSPNSEKKAQATADKLVSQIKASSSTGHRLYALTGSSDYVEPFLTPLMNALLTKTDTFTFGDRTGNSAYSILEGAEHVFAYAVPYLYEALPFVLKK